MAVCTSAAWFVTLKMPSVCTTIGYPKRQKCWPWLPKHHLLVMVGSLRATRTSGRLRTRRIGRIWRSILMLQTAKVPLCHYPSVPSRQWPPAGYCRPRRVRQRTLNQLPANTTHLWAWVPMSAAVKPSLRVSVRAMLGLTTMVTT